jgi:O-antigen/teichoic acid export membrane protein
VIAPELVVTWLLGPQWLEAIPLLRILTFAGLVQSFSSTCYTFLLAKKSYRSLNIHLVLTFSLTIVCLVLLGKTGGLVGAVTGILLARVLTTPLIWWSTQRELNIVKT